MSWFALLIAGPLGCAEPRVAPDEGGATQAIDTFVPHQGRLLLGFKAPDVRVFTFPGLTSVRVDTRGRLVSSTISGLEFRKAKLIGTGDGQTIEMHIREVIPPAAPETQWQYILEQLDASGTWVPACDSPAEIVPPNEPPESPTRAYAMAGTWLADGLFRIPAGVTFACKTGVVGKCSMWGYPAGAAWPHTTKLGNPTPALGPDVLQACSRMARADYCATGMPNTLDGTPIHIDDVFTYGPPDPNFPFEAAWAGVAMSDRAGAHRPPVVCLSKLRWSTLPLGGNCPLIVPDPRQNAKARFCDDMSFADMEARGALVYSSSTFMDAGLWTYRDPSTGHRFTTASLVPSTGTLPPTWTIPDHGGVPFPVPGQPPPDFEATIFAAKLPVAIPDTELIKLNSFRCGDNVMTTTTPQGDCTHIATEGWVYPPNTSGFAPLRRWHAGGVMWTTAAASSQMLGDGWELDEVVGAVLRAAIPVLVRWNDLGPLYQYAVDVETRAGEWIPSCVSAISGPALAFNGQCGTRAVNHADVIAFRVTATSVFPWDPVVISPPQPYDGYTSDVYVPIDGYPATALALHWNAVPERTYAVEFSLGGIWVPCEDAKQLANDTSYVHTGECYGSGQTAKLGQISAVRVCAQKEGVDTSCAEQPYAGEPSLTFAL